MVFKTPFADWASLFDDLLPAHIAERWAGTTASTISTPPCSCRGALAGGVVAARRVDRARPQPPLVGGPTEPRRPGPLHRDRGGRWPGRSPGTGPGGVSRWLRPTVLAQVSSSSLLLSSRPRHGHAPTRVQRARPPVNAVGVREGIAHAVDRAALVPRVGQPEIPRCGRTIDHLFANTDPGYIDDATGYDSEDPWPPPASSSKAAWPRPRDVDLARHTLDLRSCGRATTRGRRRRGPSWRRS